MKSPGYNITEFGLNDKQSICAELNISDKSSLERQLLSKSERFDYILEQNEDFEEAKIIYKEIKELRLKLNKRP